MQTAQAAVVSTVIGRSIQTADAAGFSTHRHRLLLQIPAENTRMEEA